MQINWQLQEYIPMARRSQRHYKSWRRSLALDSPHCYYDPSIIIIRALRPESTLSLSQVIHTEGNFIYSGKVRFVYFFPCRHSAWTIKYNSNVVDFFTPARSNFLQITEKCCGGWWSSPSRLTQCGPRAETRAHRARVAVEEYFSETRAHRDPETSLSPSHLSVIAVSAKICIFFGQMFQQHKNSTFYTIS